MNDKKEYNNVLKAITRGGSVQSAYNKLTEIAVDTEDGELRKILLAVLSTLKFEVHRKKPVLDIFDSGQSRTNLLALAKYCQVMAARSEPQWMILARRANWTPPAAS